MPTPIPTSAPTPILTVTTPAKSGSNSNSGSSSSNNGGAKCGTPGVLLVDRRKDEGYVTPVECVGEYETFVSRLRVDPSVENGLSMWVVSDNLRKGAALNAVQIAELLVRDFVTAPRTS